MDYSTQLVVCLALVGVCSAAETIVASFTDGPSPLKLNLNDDVTIECVIKSDEAPLYTHVTKWYKEQAPNDLIPVGEGKEEKAPFNNPNKYVIEFEIQSHDKATGNTQSLYTLTIRGIDWNDAGIYRCGSGQTDDQLEKSNAVELTLAAEASVPTLKTTAPKDNDVFNFNLTNQVSCEAIAMTSSKDVKLLITVKDKAAGPEFTGVKLLNWEGSTDGLKMPKTSVSLTNSAWQPQDFGQTIVQCQLFEEDRLLGETELTAVRDEPLPEVKIECYSNYGSKRVQRDDTDLAIICTASDTDRIKNMHVEFAFYNFDEKVVLKMGEYRYGRLVKADPVNDQKFILDIPRATREVVTPGQNIYNVSIYGEGSSDEPAAFHQFILPVDNTEKYSGAQTALPMGSLILLSYVASLLLSERLMSNHFSPLN